jgi:hypothetical protein
VARVLSGGGADAASGSVGALSTPLLSPTLAPPSAATPTEAFF